MELLPKVLRTVSGLRPSASTASQRRRSHILDVTRELIAERGIDKVVVADVAERAAVSVSTIYNLVGTRDRLLVALLDDVADRTRAALGNRTEVDGIGACREVVRTACGSILGDACTVRSVLGSLGHSAPDQWLDDGLGGTIRTAVDGAASVGELDGTIARAAVALGVQLGFRGALISWVFGLIDDAALTPTAELMALNVLANAAAPAVRSSAARSLADLATTITELDITGEPR